MRRAWIPLLVILMSLAIASFAAVRSYYQSQVEAPAPMTGLGVLHDYLGLNAQQRQVVDEINSRNVEHRVKLRDEVRLTREELIAVLSDADSDKERGLAAARRFGDAQQAMQENTIDHIFELRRHLNPEQKEKLAVLMSRGLCGVGCGPQSGMGKGMGRGMGRGRAGCSDGMGLSSCY